MTDYSIVTARVFQAKDYTKALEHKEQTGGIMRRFLHPTLGPCYEVRYIPPVEVRMVESIDEAIDLYATKKNLVEAVKQLEIIKKRTTKKQKHK